MKAKIQGLPCSSLKINQPGLLLSFFFFQRLERVTAIPLVLCSKPEAGQVCEAKTAAAPTRKVQTLFRHRYNGRLVFKTVRVYAEMRYA